MHRSTSPCASRRSTHVRTWARLPAGWPRSGSDTDCSESTTTSAGRWRSTAASMASTSGPSMASRFGGTTPMRDARPRTWARDSSAEASITSSPVAARDDRTWNRSVDFPIPGGPKTSVTEPATTPPPMTRSSSLTPVGSGWVASVGTSDRARAGDPSARPDRERERRTGAGPSVFHSPQAGQRPAQRSEVASHEAHTKPPSARVRGRGTEAMAAPYGRGVTWQGDPSGRRRGRLPACRPRPRRSVPPPPRTDPASSTS